MYKRQNFFTVRPEPLTAEEKKAYLAGVTGVSLGSDAFFPFGDNIERAPVSYTHLDVYKRQTSLNCSKAWRPWAAI